MIQKVMVLKSIKISPSSGWEWENGFIKMDTLEVDAQDLISHRTENELARFSIRWKTRTSPFKNT